MKDKRDMIRMNPGDISVYGAVKVEERGQIVNPSESIKEFDVKPCDSLLIISTPMKNRFAFVKAKVAQEVIRRKDMGLVGVHDRKKRTLPRVPENEGCVRG